MSGGLSVLLVGATGLVGAGCASLLEADGRIARIVRLQRRQAGAWGKSEVVVADFERFDALDDSVFAVDAAICALGTTIRQAGSQQAFRRVDHDYVVAVAERARRAGALGFGLVSALGADAASRVFYNRVKGEVEAALRALDFRSLSIVRPSLLVGNREAFRLGERLMTPLGKLLPAKWRAVSAGNVAKALVESVIESRPGVRTFENRQLVRYT